MKGISIFCSFMLFAWSNFAVASLFTFNFNPQTDGYLYKYHSYGGADADTTSEYIGVLQGNESVTFNSAIHYVNGPFTSVNDVYTHHSIQFTLMSQNMASENGLWFTPIEPDFTPTYTDQYSSLIVDQRWNDFVDPSRVDSGGTQISFQHVWVASVTDEAGITSGFHYSRYYTFLNRTVLTSLTDLGTLTDDIFFQVVQDPNTIRYFSESISGGSSFCSTTSCTSLESYMHWVEGTFTLDIPNMVDEPYGIYAICCLGLILISRKRRH